MKTIDNNNAKKIESCIEQLKRRDISALEELYSLISTAVYSYAYSILKNRYDAEDVLHDCFLKIYCSAENYKSLGRPLAWIMRITHNLCYDVLRKRQTEAVSDDNIEDCISYDISHEDHAVIYACMEILSDSERQIVFLHAISKLKHREISRLLNVPLSTVLSKYNRAIKKLKKELEE